MHVAAISRIRRQIDALDRKLVALLNQRVKRSLAIGRMKRGAGLRLFHHAREREISRRVAQANRGPLSGLAVQRLWQEILQQTRGAVRAALHKEERRERAAFAARKRSKR